MESARVYLAAFRAALLAKFEYKVDLVLGVVTSTLLQLSALGFLWVILHQTPSLADWSGAEVVFLFGLTAAALGLSELLFNHIWMLPYYVVQGDLDRLLVYPVRSLPFLLVSRPELHSFGNLATGILLLCAAGSRLDLPAAGWLLLPLWTACGSVTYTSALVAFGTLAFRFLSPYGYAFFIPQNLLQAARYPLPIYPGWMRFVLLFVVPYGAFTTLPAGWLLGKLSHPLFAALPVLAAAAAAAVAQFLWNLGLKRYESTGS